MAILPKTQCNFFQTLGYNTERSAHLTKPDFNTFKESYLTLTILILTKQKHLYLNGIMLICYSNYLNPKLLKQTTLFDTKKVDNTTY